MRSVVVCVGGARAGLLVELEAGHFRFTYDQDYSGPPVSLALPVSPTPYEFTGFPPFFDGLLPEGVMLEGLLRQEKLDAGDCLGQLLSVGQELVGSVTVKAVT